MKSFTGIYDSLYTLLISVMEFIFVMASSLDGKSLGKIVLMLLL